MIGLARTATVLTAPVCLALMAPRPVCALELLSPQDFIVAIDAGGAVPQIENPAAEGPTNALDESSAKYLNLDGPNSSFIVTPLFEPSLANCPLFSLPIQ